MPIKPSKKEKMAEPVVRFYLAEDLRQELNSKVSAIGLYSDNVVVVPLPLDRPDPTVETPILLKSLGFLFNITNVRKATTISIDLEFNGARRPFMKPQKYPDQGPGRSIILMGVMQPCAVTSFGEKTLFVKVGELDYAFSFEIRRAELPADIGTAIAPKITDLKTRTPVARKKSTRG